MGNFKKGDIVTCIDTKGALYLTKNKNYFVDTSSDDLIGIQNDRCSEFWYSASQFKLAESEFKPGDYVVCVNVEEQGCLTLNKIYKVKNVNKDSYINGNLLKITNDLGNTKEYYEIRFKKLELKPGDVVRRITETSGVPLTLGKDYVVKSYSGHTLEILNDKGMYYYYFPNKFSLVNKVEPQTEKPLITEEIEQNSNNLKSNQYDNKNTESTGISIKVNRLVPRISTDSRARGNAFRSKISKNSIRFGHLSNRKICRLS